MSQNSWDYVLALVLATKSQVNFSVETPEICKHTDETPEIFDYKDLNAKFVAMKNEIYELKLEIKSLKGGIEKINSKSSPEKNYDHELNIKNSFLEQQNSFLKQEIISKQNIIDKLLDIQSDQLKTDLILKEKGDNMINVNNDSINGIARGFSRSNEIMTYSGSNTRIGITTDERNKQSITKKLQNNIKIKDNTNKNHTVDNNNIQEKNKKIIIIGDLMLRFPRSKFLPKNNNFVSVRFDPGTTTEDIVDFIKPVIRKKPNAVIIHPGTNDLTNGTNTMKQARKITKTI